MNIKKSADLAIVSDSRKSQPRVPIRGAQKGRAEQVVAHLPGPFLKPRVGESKFC